MEWNLLSIFLIFKVSTKDGGQNSAELWKLNEAKLNIPDPIRPNFYTKGVRISEAKCREYIWDIQEEEKAMQRITKYKQEHPNMVSVIGGRDAIPGEFPHMGAVGWKGKKAGEWVFMCGSSLISQEFLLTAAHCYMTAEDERVDGPRPVIVRLGVENIKKVQSPVDVNILRFINHNRYNGAMKRYFDIALIQLTQRVTFNLFVRPACIRNQDVTRGTVTGWGIVDQIPGSKSTSAHLQVAHVDIVESRRCDRMLKRKKNKLVWTGVQDYQMCATKRNGTGDTCSGDSGGPLQVMIATNTKIPMYNVIGVTSFGFRCGSSLFPSIYTKTNSFLDWIENVVWKEEM